MRWSSCWRVAHWARDVVCARKNASCDPQAIYLDSPETSEVGAVGRRTKEKGKDYGDWWGARATGSCSGVDELTWFIRWVYVGCTRCGQRHAI